MSSKRDKILEQKRQRLLNLKNTLPSGSKYAEKQRAKRLMENKYKPGTN
jgi:hypothetical protein